MSAPRLEIDLGKIHHNARTLVDRLALRGIAVTGVVKATLGSPEIANVLLQAGVQALGESRIENIETLRRADIKAPITLIRSPMLSQVERVVMNADISFNTELDVIRKLSMAAQGTQRTHGVVLMVELGDLREGIMPDELLRYVKETLRLPNITLRGIGTNLACRNGVVPDSRNMGELSALAGLIEAAGGEALNADFGMVSGGNSANLQWALGCQEPGRINDLRLGESILLGCDPLQRQPVEGLFTDAIVLVAEVIESGEKPTLPRGAIAQNAYGESPRSKNRGRIQQSILAIGQQDVDPAGLHAAGGITVLGASSDHLIIETSGEPLNVGAELEFRLSYSALLRSMTSPFVSKQMKGKAMVSDRRGIAA